MIFGEVIKSERKPLSPRVTVAMDTNATRGDGVALGESGMGVKDEAMGLVVGGKGLREIGKELIDEDDDD